MIFNIFHFESSFIECILPFNIVDKEKYYRLLGSNVYQKSDLDVIIDLIKSNKEITLKDMALKLDKSVITV